MKLNLLKDGIIKKTPTSSSPQYAMYGLRSAVGVVYLTPRSPHYLSGHLRLTGRKNGQYPYGYKSMINELFGDSSSLQVIEVCAGDAAQGFNLYTVDINPDKHPSLVCDGSSLPDDLANRFDRWYCDPPYNQNTAAQMYDTELPSFSKLLTSGAKVVKVRGLLFFLIGNKNMQWCPSSLVKIGHIFCTIVPLQEVRTLHIYYKHS